MNGIDFLKVNADTEALALTKYLGTFTEAWRNQPTILDSGLPVIHRTFQEDGKDFQHLQFASRPPPEEFDPGDEILGQNYAMDEVRVSPDKYLVASAFIKRDQMKKSHVTLIPQLARSHAREIKLLREKRIFITAALAARDSAKTKDGLLVHSGGNRVTVTGGSLAAAFPLSATGAATFRSALRTLALRQDEDNIPSEGRYLWVPPYMKSVALYDNTAQVFSEEYQDPSRPNVVGKRQVTLLENYKLVGAPNFTSNNGTLPDQLIIDQPSKYNADFRPGVSNGTPVAITLCQGPDGGAAVSEVTFDEVQSFVKYFPERMGWLLVSFIMSGVGKTDSYCAGSIELIS